MIINLKDFSKKCIYFFIIEKVLVSINQKQSIFGRENIQLSFKILVKEIRKWMRQSILFQSINF